MRLSSAESKKARERRFVDAFLKLSKMSAVVLEQRETPDFLLEFERRTIGLEVTEVFIEDAREAAIKPKAAESMVDQVVKEARRRYDERGGKPLHVSLGFAPNADLRSVNRKDAAEAIAKLLLDSEPPLGERFDWHPPAVGNNPLLPQLAFIHALSVETQGMAHWQAPLAGWVSPITSNSLQPYVNDKAAKIGEYRRAANEVWLLLAIEGRAPSQFFEPAADVLSVTSPFDRSYLLFLFNGTVQRLS